MNEKARSLTALALIAAMLIALFALLPHGIPEKSRVARWSDAAATDYLSGHRAEDVLPETAPSCRFTWLPEGYRLGDSGFPESDHHRFTAALTAEDGRDAFFSCEINRADWSLSLDYDESYQVRTVSVGEESGELYLCPDGSRPTSLVWQAEDGGLVLCLTGYLSGEELLAVARGVVLER